MGTDINLAPALPFLLDMLKNSKGNALQEELQSRAASGNYLPIEGSLFVDPAITAKANQQLLDQAGTARLSSLMRDYNDPRTTPEQRKEMEADPSFWLGARNEDGGGDKRFQPYADKFTGTVNTQNDIQHIFGNLGQGKQPDAQVLSRFLTTNGELGDKFLKGMLDTSQKVGETGTRNDMSAILIRGDLSPEERSRQLLAQGVKLKGSEGEALIKTLQGIDATDNMKALTRQVGLLESTDPNTIQDPTVRSKIVQYQAMNPSQKINYLSTQFQVDPKVAADVFQNAGYVNDYKLHDVGGSNPNVKQAVAIDKFGRTRAVGNEFSPVTSKIVNNIMPEALTASAMKAFGPQVVQDTGKRYEAVQKTAEMQRDYVNMYKLLQQGAPSGWGQEAVVEAKRLASVLGVKDKTLNNQQLFDAISKNISTKAVRQTDANPTQKQIEMVIRTFPGLSGEQARNVAQIQLAMQANSANIQSHNQRLGAFKQLAGGDPLGDAMAAQYGVQDPAANITLPSDPIAAMNSGASMDKRPSASDYAGKKIRDTKTGRTYQSNGKAWVEVR